MESDNENEKDINKSKGMGEGKIFINSFFDDIGLPVGTCIADFEIVGIAGVEGTYIEYDAVYHGAGVGNKQHVRVLEYFPSGLARRNSDLHVIPNYSDGQEVFELGLRSFINEARMLAKFEMPGLVKVFNFLEANGTAYMATPLYKGISVKSAFASKKIIPTEAWVRTALLELLEVASQLHHVSLFHRNINVANVRLLDTGRLLLLGVDAANRAIAEATQHTQIHIMTPPSYVAVEALGDIPNMKIGPWTDIYALGAFAYYLITGKHPVPPVARFIEDKMLPAVVVGAGKFSQSFLVVIDQALAIKPEHRFQSAVEMQRMLEKSETSSEEITIENCRPDDFSFLCTSNWDHMKVGSSEKVRHCYSCQKNVYLCTSNEELNTHIKAKHCVAVPKPQPISLGLADEIPPLPLLGYLCPPKVGAKVKYRAPWTPPQSEIPETATKQQKKGLIATLRKLLSLRP